MLKSWLDIPADSDFSIYNLPYGIFSLENGSPSVGVAIGEWIIDMSKAQEMGLFSLIEISENVFDRPILNDLIGLGKSFSKNIRSTLQASLTNPHSQLCEKASEILVKRIEARMHLPLRVGDYTDFYSSEEHATTVGKLFRPSNPQLPNWKQMPVAYHGRASSIVVSKAPISRPKGQIKYEDSETPVFAPTECLDYELELAFVIGKNSELGKSVGIDEAEEYVFGALLFNDWSARDIQRWENQPLGPFTSKNFASSVSPWIVTLDALESFKIKIADQEPKPLDYLYSENNFGFDINLSVEVISAKGNSKIITETNSKHLYWSISQQVAHHTITGCNLRIGDLLATGTISGPEINGAGCLLESTKAGAVPFLLSNESRTYLEDGDEVIMHGYAQNGEIRVGFGTLSGKILPSFT